MIANTGGNKERIQKFDIARTFAILCVVLCHSVEIAYLNISKTQLSDVSRIFWIVFFTIGRLGVPIFLFLTGALILKKQIENDEDINKFYIKNLLPLLITIEIWNVIYNIFLGFINKQFDIEVLLRNLLFDRQVNMPNMWYMPMILGMYFSIPFVAKIVKSFTIKTIKIPMILVFIVYILLPSLNELLSRLGVEGYRGVLNLSFLGGTYGLYILLGYYIDNELLEKYSNIFLITVAIVNFMITCIFQYYTYEIKIGYDVWYNFITLFISSICIFELFTRIKNKVKGNLLIKSTKYLSKISLGIFFVHAIFLNLFRKDIAKMNLKNPLESILLFTLTIICSIIFIYLTSKIKFIKEKVFLIKD